MRRAHVLDNKMLSEYVYLLCRKFAIKVNVRWTKSTLTVILESDRTRILFPRKYLRNIVNVIKKYNSRIF